MIQLIHWPLDQSWHLVINLPPPPEPDGWWSWWYIPLIFALWSIGTGVAAKLVWGWDRIQQWEVPSPLFWPLGLPYYLGARLTRRWMVWRDYRNNCKLAVKSAK